jgi:hypothetical protein
MQRLRRLLKAIFSPTRRLATAEAPCIQQGGRLGPAEWVALRSECRYRRFDFTSVPARRRSTAAKLALQRELGQPGDRGLVAWTGAVAHTWIWEPSEPARAIAGPDSRWLPETLLAMQPLADGARLLQLSQGYEGQVWAGGMLLACQWWRERPGAEDWNRFRRACSLAPEAQSVDVRVEAPVLAAPWGNVARARVVSGGTEHLAWRVALAVIAFTLGWQWWVSARWDSALHEVEAHTQQLRERAAPLIEARERADTAHARIQAYADLAVGVNDYLLMAEVMRPLPQGAKLSMWLREDERLQVGVQSVETDPRVFVAAFEDHPLLSNVKAAPAEVGVVRLDFELARPATTADAGSDA